MHDPSPQFPSPAVPRGSYRPWLIALWLSALVALPVVIRASGSPAPEAAPAAGGHGEAPKADAHGGAGAPQETVLPEGATPTPVPTPKPDWQVEEPLHGRFDIKALRALDRVAVYRLELPKVEERIGPPERSSSVMFTCTVEFGGPSGCAELESKQALVMEDMERVASKYTPQELRPPAGRERLREDLIFAINRRLETARVRQLYFMEYLVGR